jgi:hypothetical protein
MKKSIFILILSLISFNSFSQSENENKVTFDSTTYIGTAIINVPGVSKDELYKRVKLWISSAYKSGKTVTDLDDKSGDVYTIVLKAKKDVHVVHRKGFSEYEEENDYSVIIKIKDSKLKLEIKDWNNNGYFWEGSLHYAGGGLNNPNPPNAGHTKKTWNQVREAVADFTKDLLSSYSNEMLNPAKSNDDF